LSTTHQIPQAAASWLPPRPVVSSKAKKVKDPLRFIKWGIWSYYFLLIFEGALRKWFLPGLSAPLLIVRDPVAIILIMMALFKGVFPKSPYVVVMGAVTLISMAMTRMVGHGNDFVMLFGARLFLIHFPLIFIIGTVFERKDVINMGIVTLCIVIPMTVLVALQFYSPQSAWVNRGVGGDEEGAGFTGALDYMRPPGTFSFTNGNTLFYGFAAAFAVYFWITEKQINKYLLFLATAGILLTVPLSISRYLLAEILISSVFATATVLRRPKYAGRLILAAIVIFLAFLILSQISIFQTATEALTTRFDDAEYSEGATPLQAFIDRFTSGISFAIRHSDKIPFFGKGLGMGTNVGALLLTGSITFLISEGEWGRIIGEMGFFLGGIIIITRVVFVISNTIRGYRFVAKGNLLPWMLMSFGGLSIFNGQWGQPTSLGFSILIGGLILASFKRDIVKKAPEKKQSPNTLPPQKLPNWL
jgi:hypothetical protein